MGPTLMRELRSATLEYMKTDHVRGHRRTTGGSGGHQADNPIPGVAKPPFDLLASKLLPPVTRPGTVGRSLLIERLLTEGSRPIVSVVAPAGYGKTTLLSQWAERDTRPFGWVSLDEADNDPKVLLTYVAAALDAIEPVGEPLYDSLSSPASSVPGSVVPRLGSALSRMSSPLVLVLDDVHVLRNREGQAALSVLADHVPSGSQLVLASRGELPLRVARMRAHGRVLEVGAGDLSLDLTEASVLLGNAGVTLGDDDIAELHGRTEGWPAGLYLAALSIREGGAMPRAAVSFGGGDRLVSEYIESEVLARMSWRQRVFLTRTAVLERLSVPRCQAVLEEPGSGAMLEDLARSNSLLVTLDRHGEAYRYHHLFGEMLMGELQRREPEMLPVLRRRAAAWCAENNLPEEALRYSMAAGDVGTAARLVAGLTLPAYRQGRVTTVQGWFRWLEEHEGTESYPMAAVMASMFSAVTGRPAQAERWADAVDRWRQEHKEEGDDPVAEAWATFLGAYLGRLGVGRMLDDADEAMQSFPRAGLRELTPALMQGVGRLLSGDLEGADVSFVDACVVGEEIGASPGLAAALAERALVAMAMGDAPRAEAFARQSRAVLLQAGMEEYIVHPWFAPYSPG